MRMILAALAVFFVAGAAQAQPMCGPRAEIIASLKDDYKETQLGAGTVPGDTGLVVLEVFTGQSGTWTVLMTNPHGITCIMASGRDWQPQHGGA